MGYRVTTRMEMRDTIVTRLRRLVAHPVGAGALAAIGTFAGYVALARGFPPLVTVQGGLSAFWPPNGLVVGLLVLLPAQLRIWVLIPVIPAEISTGLLLGYHPLAALGWGTANLLESALAAWIILTVARRRPRGDRTRDFVALAAAALTAPLAGGALGSAASVAFYGGGYLDHWTTWWLGDAAGMLLVVPVVLSFARRGAPQTWLGHVLGILELGLVVGVTAVLFGLTTAPLAFLVLPPLVLLALRHGLRLTAIASVLFATVATLFTGRGAGPFAGMTDPVLRVMALQAFIATTAFVGFLICAAIAERRLAEARLEELATQDPLTGLANRRRLLEALDRVTARRDRSFDRTAILYFDLDNFKEINDAHGHVVGDAVLVEVGARLAAGMRQTDLVARLGGDEFAALLEPVDGLSGAELTARRLVNEVERPPVDVHGTPISVGVSVGVALIGSDSTAALSVADRRLYGEKPVPSLA